MCGRYSITTAPEAMRRLFDVDTALNLEPRWNLAPTQAAPVIKLLDGAPGRERHRALAMMRWGLVPSWAKDIDIGVKMINARSETVTEKPAFRAAYRYRRCLVPADGFYEWRTEAGIKQPYRVVRRDRAPFAFAGLWEMWEGRAEGSALESFSILTTDANATIAHIHHRMPVMLFDQSDFATWLEADVKEAGTLLHPCDPAAVEAYPVDRRVGNVRNDDPGLADPIDPAPPSKPVQGSLF
jgi:putative SOS response-associated peptidase YedK